MDRPQPANFKKSNNHQLTDVRVILTKYFFHWPLFLLGLSLAFAGAYFYLQIANPVYEINASILVKDQKKSPQEKAALQELNQSASAGNAETEIEILRSKNIVSQVVDDLQLWTSYERSDGLKTEDLYETTPFKFNLLKTAGTLKKQNLEILIKDNRSFELQNENGDVQIFPFNKPVKSSLGSWMLTPTENIDQFIGSVITIHINNQEKVSNEYVKSLDAHLLDKAAPTIGLSITDEVTQRGKDFLNNIIKAYNSATSEEEKRTTKSTIDFIDKRLTSLTGELNSAEREVEGYRSSKGLTDISSQSKVYLENVQTNDGKLNEVNVQLNVIEGIERYVNSASGNQNSPATIGITDPALNSLIEKLSQLQLKRVALLATTPESNPIFEPINRQIKTTKVAIKETIYGIKSSLLNSKRELQAFNNKVESSIKDIPGQERQFVGMKRQQSIKENLYVYLLQKREELSLNYASTQIDARVVDQANVGDKKWPKTSFILAIAMILGLGLPFLIIYLRQAFSNTINERRDIENAVDVRVLGELSYEDLGKEIVVLDNTHHLVGEQFRSLRTNLHYLHDNKNGVGRVTLFTSSVPGEGKSFVSSNLAASLAASGRKTVILEMDLRKPKISKIFNLTTNHLGISEFLSSDLSVDKIIQPSGVNPDLYVVGSGHVPPNPSELLEKNRLNELISHLKDTYDDIIIDSPPLHLVTDAMIIAKFVDVSLYIIKQGHTGKSELSFIRRLQEDEKLPNMNIIFNGIKNGKYGYGYKYDNSYYDAGSLKPSFASSFRLFLSRF